MGFVLRSEPNPLLQLVAGVGGKFLGNYLDQQKQNKENAEIEKVLSTLNSENPPSPLDVLKSIYTSNLNSERKKEVFDAFQSIEKNRVEARKTGIKKANQTKDLLSYAKAQGVPAKDLPNLEEIEDYQTGKDIINKKAQEIKDLEEKPFKNAEAQRKQDELDLKKQKFAFEQEQANKKPSTQSAFQKKIEEKAAEDYVKTKEVISKSETMLKDLDFLQDFSKSKLSGPVGTAKGLLNVGDAAEFNTLALQNIKPVLDLINPIGIIPIGKIKLAMDKAVPKASDLQSTIDAKINAIRRMTIQGLERNKEKIALYEKYQGKIPPPEVLEEFDRETSNLGDIMIDQTVKNINEIEKNAPKKEKIKFDINNPEHIQRRNQILNQSKGNKKKANQLLAEEFIK